MIRFRSDTVCIRRTVIALLTVLLMVASTAKSSEVTFAFINVNVISMDSEVVLHNQTVVVFDGKIVYVGERIDADIPDSATIIDGTDRYLMPGLSDMHVHLTAEFPEMLLLYIANGVTTVRNMAGDSAILNWRRQIKEGSRLGPRIYTAGPVIDGDPPCQEGMTIMTSPDQAVAEVAAEKSEGYDAIKVYSNLSPGVYKAILEAALKYNIPVWGHAPTRVGLSEALGGGQKSFEHLNDFLYALLPDDSPVRAEVVEAFADCAHFSPRKMFGRPFSQADPDKIEPLAARVADRGVWICPTVVVIQKFASTAEEFAALQEEEEVQYLPSPVSLGWWGKMVGVFNSDKGDVAGMKEGVGKMLHSVKALHDAGANLLIGTDTFNPFVIPGFSVQEELQNFVDAGLTPFDAIAAATRDAAEFLGASAEWGTIQVGLSADFILINGNPLEDIENASKRVGVMVAGRWFTKQDLGSMLEEVAKKYSKESGIPANDQSEE